MAGSLSAVQEHGQELPVLLAARQGFGSGGVAFEVAIKDPEAAKIATPGKLRLEAYGENRFLENRKSPAGDQQQQRRLRSEELAEKARASNERARLTAEKVQKQKELSNETLSRQTQLVVQKIERASEKRREVLADRSTRAGRHFEEVKAKTEVCQQQKAEEHAARGKQLEAALAAKEALHNAGVVERGERAGHHNEAVADKVQKHLQEVQKHNEELMAKHRLKCGSKIDGRPHNIVVEESSTTELQPALSTRVTLKAIASHLVSILPCP